MSALATTYKFTVEDYIRLYETGILDAHDRIELLNGELIVMQAISPRHAQAVTNLTAYLGEQSRRRYMTSPQNPVELEEHSAPQPDLVLVPWSRRTARRHPTPAEVHLIIEVADSSLRYDQHDKMRAYAAVGICEFWILNLEADAMEVYREPRVADYGDRFIIGIEGTVSPLAFPDVTLPLAEIIPPR